jgi:DNA-binding protein H-NS
MASYKELMDQAKQLMQQAEELRKSELKEVVANIRSMMTEYGLTVEDLGFKAVKVDKPSSATDAADWKYSNPAKPNKGWSGKGRVPFGIKDYLAIEGHKLEDLLIVK